MMQLAVEGSAARCHGPRDGWTERVCVCKVVVVDGLRVRASGVSGVRCVFTVHCWVRE